MQIFVPIELLMNFVTCRLNFELQNSFNPLAFFKFNLMDFMIFNRQLEGTKRIIADLLKFSAS